MNLRAMMLGLLILPGCNQSANDAMAARGTSDVARLDRATANSGGATVLMADQIDVAGGRGIYTVNRDGATSRIEFPVDEKRIDPTRGHMIAPVGETPEGIVVLVDDYASRAEKGRCTDGMETFVRVFSLLRARELMAIPAGSCLDGVKRPEREATWIGPDRFRVNTEPARTYILSGSDRVELAGDA